MTNFYITSLQTMQLLSNPCIYLLLFLILGTIFAVLLHIVIAKRALKSEFLGKLTWMELLQIRYMKKKQKQELLLALKNQEFFLEFQPIVRLSDKKVVAMEALVRWNHPSKGVLYPVSFLEEMVEFSLMGELGRFVVQNAFHIYKSVLKDKPDLRLTINLSPEELIIDGFEDFILSEATKHNIPTNLIFLEITETSLLLGHPKIKEIVYDLMQLGFHISLDDFGTGFANFSKLHSLPVRGIKMDKSFLSEEEELKNYIILRSMLQLTEALKLLVVTEGVEEEKQYHNLRDMGYKYAQGYYFGRPKLIEEFVLLYI